MTKLKSLAKQALNSLRMAVRDRLLSGKARKLWVERKTDKLVSDYRVALLASTHANGKPVTEKPAFQAVDKLSRLLFICDNMWEGRELVPELRRICEVDFIDIHPLIACNPENGHEYLPFAPVASLLKPLESAPFDCLLVYLRSSLQSAELLELLRRKWKCPVIGLNLDCKTTFVDYNVFNTNITNYKKWAGSFDANLTNARAMVDVYAASGFRCLYLPTGFHFDPAIHRLNPAPSYEIPISFVGSCKPERAKVIEQMHGMGIPVQVFGGGWEGQPFIKDAWRVFQQSQLNLGIGYNVPDTRITNLKNRDFECPGSGGCYLTTYDWELGELFEIGREILCYRGMDDIAELYSYYRRRPEECARIAARGFERCRRDHTWEQRFRKIFAELGFKTGSV